MTRYVIKRIDEWAVVNANYKRSIKTFTSQKEAIVFAAKLIDTKAIIIQGNDFKFRKLSNWDLFVASKKIESIEANSSKVNFIPPYIYKYVNKEEYKNKIRNYILISITATFFALAAVFGALYGVEVAHYA